MSSAKKNKIFRIVKEDGSRHSFTHRKNYHMHNSELYLEILENKDKVLPSKLNETYLKPPTSLEYLEFDDHYSDGSLYSEDYERESNFSTSSKGTKRKIDDVENNDAEIKMINDEKKFKSDSMDRFNTLAQKNPISLEELRAKQLEADNQINNEKQMYLAKFNLMKKQYPNENIPFVSMQTDLQFMKNEYNKIFRELRLNAKHQQMKQYLILVFYGIEFLLGKFGKFDMSGYTEAQLNNMEKYDRLLYELGDKHFMPDAPERFPVEVRLVGLIVIQTAIFIVMQNITKKMTSTGNSGSNLFGFINKFISGGVEQALNKNNPPSAQQSSSFPQQPTMSGPKMDI